MRCTGAQSACQAFDDTSYPYSVVDFGVNYGHPDGPFTNQSAFNPAGKSPYYNSEF